MRAMTKTLELRNIKHSPSLSEETYAYTATLYVNGKAFCNVSNHGTGGCDMQHPIAPNTMVDIRELNDWCKANLPRWKLNETDAEGHETDLDMWCANALSDQLVSKDLQRALKSKVLYAKEGDKAVYETRFKGVRTLNAAQLQDLIQKVKQKHPTAVILNTMPFDQALAMYRKAS